MSEIKVPLGEPIPLNAQETSRDTTKVVRATLYDMADFSIITGPITLAHQVEGAYFDDSFPFPANVKKIFAQYLVFDSDGTTPNSTGEKAVFDIFTLDEEVTAARLDFTDIVVDVESTEVIVEVEDNEIEEIIETADVEIEVDDDEVTGVADSANIEIDVEGVP